MATVRKRTWIPSGSDKERTAYVVDYRDRNGRRFNKQFEYKRDADVYLVQVQAEIQKGIHTPESVSIKLSDAADRWLKRREADGLEASTIRQYTNHVELHIKPFIGNQKLANLTVPLVMGFLDDLHDNGRSPTMVRKVRATLVTILNFCMERGLVAQNNARAASAPKKSGRDKRKLDVGIHIPSEDEVKTLIQAASGRFRVFLITAIFTGMRASELRGLAWDAVDFNKGVIRVRQRADEWGVIGEPKSRAGRRDIPMTPKVKKALMEWKLKSDTPGDLVFANKTGRPDHHRNLWNRHYAPLQLKAGVTVEIPRKDKDGAPVVKPKYGFHALRHFYASWLIDQGFPPKRIQEALGHASITMTFDTYGHLFPDDEQELRKLAAAEAAFFD